MRNQETSDESELVELYRTTGLPEAYALKVALGNAGIPGVVDNELLQGAAGEVPLGWHTAPRIKVPKHLLESAQEVLLAFLAEATDAAAALAAGENDDRCLACGTPLNGCDTCAECGWSWDSEGRDAAAGSEDHCSENGQTHLQADIGPSGNADVQPAPVSVNELGFVLSVVWLLPLAEAAITHVWPDLLPVTSYAARTGLTTAELLASIVVTSLAISRSNESWQSFGVTRPGPGTLLGGVVVAAMLQLAYLFYSIMTMDFAPKAASAADPLTPPGTYDNALYVFGALLHALADNLVFAAYLNIRLTTFLKSRWKAVVLTSLLYSSLFPEFGVYLAGLSFVHALSVCMAFQVFRRLWPLVLGQALIQLAAFMGWV